MQARLHGPARRRPTALMILTSFVMAACSAAPGVSTSSPTQSAATTPAAPTVTPSAAASAVTGCTVITKDEATTVLGRPPTGAFEAAAEIGPLLACGFSAGFGPNPRLGVAVARNGAAQFEQIKASALRSTPLPGVGDEAFSADESGSGGGPFLVGALKGGTAVYLSLDQGTATQFEAMKTLLATALTRI